MKIVTDSLLATTYATQRRGHISDTQVYLTHSYDDDISPRVSLCKRINESQKGKFAGDHKNEPPTCALCLKRDPRFNGGGK